MNLRIMPLIALLTLVACAQLAPTNHRWRESVNINPTLPPEGEHVMQILLENQSFPLKGTGCETGPDDTHTLQHLLAGALGAGLDSSANGRHEVVISGGCKPERFELRSGSVIDGWRCKLITEERDAQTRDRIYSSSIAFGIQKNTWALITDSLTPNPLICMP